MTEAQTDLTQEERAYLQANPILTFVSGNNQPPLIFFDENGLGQGVYVDVIRWMSQEIGFTPKFIYRNHSKVPESLKNGEADVFMTSTSSKEGVSEYSFSSLVMEVPNYIFVSTQTDSIKTFEDLKQKIVAVPRGSEAEGFLKRSILPLRIYYTADFPTALRAVVDGKADALIGDMGLVNYTLNNLKLNGRLKANDRPVYTSKLFLATAKDDLLLLGLLNKGVLLAKNSKVMEKLKVKWQPVPPSSDGILWLQYRAPIISVVLLIIVLFLVVVFFNMRLRNLVHSRTAQIKKSEIAYRSLTENSTDLVLRHDARYKIRYINLAVARFVDKRIRELQDVTLVEAGFPPEVCRQWEERIGEVFVSGISSTMLLHGTTNGVPWWLDCRLIPEFAMAQQVETVLSTCRDITESKKAETERRTLELQMQQAQKLESLGVMAGGIAHDFNNLLATIRGNVELALLDENLNDSQRQHLVSIDETTQQASNLCSQMLAYTGKAQFAAELIDLNALVIGMKQLLKVSLAKKASIKLNLIENLPLIQGNPTQIQQILMNLVLNAAESTGNTVGTIIIETEAKEIDEQAAREKVTPLKPTSGNYVYLKVSDNGSGMNAETLARIFDPFFTTKFTGRGLGLAAVLGIIKSHNGFMHVTSELGVGSVFTIWFPVVEGEHKILPQPMPKSLPAWKGTGTVLLAEDDLFVQNVISKLLVKAGFQVIMASNGQEALDLFVAHEGKFSAVLLDLTMPVMDGVTAMRKMKELNPKAKIIISSGYHAMEAEAMLDFNERPTAFLQKPYSYTQLIDVLKVASES
ncbi:MAG: transporter substrate-binding domain-containing protein [Blastochloris sp.]|nr:transporter substrate-binding domain-containing protein [Blastochloris sp.]